MVVRPADIGVKKRLAEETQQGAKKLKRSAETQTDALYKDLTDVEISSLLKNRPQDDHPDRLFVLSLLPLFKDFTSDQKIQLFIKFLNAVQNVKNAPAFENSYRKVPTLVPTTCGPRNRKCTLKNCTVQPRPSTAYKKPVTNQSSPLNLKKNEHEISNLAYPPPPLTAPPCAAAVNTNAAHSYPILQHRISVLPDYYIFNAGHPQMSPQTSVQTQSSNPPHLAPITQSIGGN